MAHPLIATDAAFFHDDRRELYFRPPFPDEFPGRDVGAVMVRCVAPGRFERRLVLGEIDSELFKFGGNEDINRLMWPLLVLEP